jgi:hypothetical protein
MDDMTCGELADVAAELALGVLTGRERAAALAHLETCEACQEDVRQLMATGGQLLELLPPVEPPAGFETRVLDRLGLPAPAQGPVELLQAGRGRQPRRRRLTRGRARPSAGQPGSGQPSAGQPSAGQPSVGRPSAGRPGGGTAARPGGTSRVRRALAATAIGLAVIAAGLGGWRIGAGTSPAPVTNSAAAPLTSATLLSATHQDVGNIFLYSGKQRWMYMSVDLGAGDESVTCQVVGTDGRVTTVGKFQLAGGYGGWGTPDPGNAGSLRGAQLVTADGTVLATATFTSW